MLFLCPGGRGLTSHWSRRLTRQVLWACTCLVAGGPPLTSSVRFQDNGSVPGAYARLVFFPLPFSASQLDSDTNNGIISI